MKVESLEKSKCKIKTNEGADIVSDPSNVSVDTSKVGEEENGASTSDHVYVFPS